MREDVEHLQRVIDRVERRLRQAQEGDAAVRRRLDRLRQQHAALRRMLEEPGRRRP